MSDSVGKISLDLEIQSDISKQISNVSNMIGNNLKKSLNSSMKSTLENVNSSTKKTMNNITNNINSSMKKSMANIAKTMKSILSNIKMPKMNIPKPTNISTPKTVEIGSNSSKRGPPSLELEDLTNAKLGKIQELDITDRQIDNLRNKLKLLSKQLDNTFDSEGRNKLEGTILSTESRMNSLINKSEKLGKEIINLDNKIDSFGKSTNTSTDKASRGMNSLTNSSKKTNNALKSHSSTIGIMARRMLTWRMMFPMILRGLTSMATGLLNNLKTNEQFSNSLAQIKSNLMIAFTPIYEAILPAINALMSALSIATQYIASFISAIFGKTFNQSKQATQGIIDAKNAMGAYGDAAKEAGKKAKDALGLASFDEINSLNSNDDSSGSGGVGGGGAGVPQLVTPELETSNIDSAMKNLVDKIKAYFGTFNFEPLIQSFNRLKKSIEPIVNNLGKIIKWFLVEILDPLAHWTISDLLPAFLNLIAGALDFLNPILEVFMSLGSWLWDSFLQPIASWTGGVIVDVLNGLADILSSIGNWISEHKPLIEDLILVIGSFAVAWGLVTGAINLWNIAIGIWNSVGVIATAVTTGFGVAMASVNWPILIAIAAIGAIIAIGVLLYKHWDLVKAKAIEVWNKIKETISKSCDNAKEKTNQFKGKVVDAWDNIKNKFNEFKNWLGNVFATDWSKKFGFFGDILNGFLANVRNVFNSVKQIFSGIIDFIAGVFTGNWSRAWQGVVNIFSGIMDGLSSVMKAPLNAVISLINGAISGLNKIAVDIPDWVPSWAGGGKHFGVNIPSVPYLAKGGIIDSPTLAMVGEAGKEAVVPLENNTEWTDKMGSMVANAVLSAMQFSGGFSNNNSGSGDVYLQIDGTTFARLINPYQQREKDRVGSNVILKTV